MDRRLLLAPLLLVVIIIGGVWYINWSQRPKTYKATGVIKEFAISVQNWFFNVTTITVTAGDTVVITLEALDNGDFYGHSFESDDFPIDIVVRFDQGEAARIVTGQFVANKVGTFSWYCGVECGEGHDDMIGTINVLEP
jgi:heme/copper-type cytochrome/quinol oxidase subunit 2